jgi:transposase-like protein
LSSIVLPWTDIKSYRAQIGPSLERPPRPTACPVCPCRWIWYDGWRFVFSVVLAEGGQAQRLDEGLPLQRVACARCWKSWTLWPAFLYPRRQFSPDVSEAAALAYLATPGATYVEVGARFGCSWTSVWRWVGWLGRLTAPEDLLAAIVRLVPDSPAIDLVPRDVPQDHDKAYSAERVALLLGALRTVVLICLLWRALPTPPADPSPLRWLLWVQFRAFPRPIGLGEGVASPAFHIDRRGPPSA